MPSFSLHKRNPDTKKFEPYILVCESQETSDIATLNQIVSIASKENYKCWWGRFPQGIYKVVCNDVTGYTRAARFYVERFSPSHIDQSERLISLTMDEIPWINKAWFVEGDKDNNKPVVVHAKLNEPTQLGFFENAEKAAFEKPTYMTVGRYLKKYYEGATHDEIEDMCQQWAKLWDVDYEVLTETADIVNAYLTGPSSCMSYSLDSYNHPSIHPTAVYGGDSDIKMMVVKRGGKITGRCLVWPKEKQHVTMYGDYARLEKALNAEGYERGDFEGAKLNRIPYRDTFVAPYLDCITTISDQGDYFLVDSDGPLCWEYTNGICGNYTDCSSCGELSDDTTYVNEEEDAVCNNCLSENYTFCHTTHEYILNTDCKTYRGRWGERFMSEGDLNSQITCDNMYLCQGSDMYYLKDYHPRIILHDGTVWSDRHFDRHGFSCSHTLELYPMDEMTTSSNGDVVAKSNLEEYEKYLIQINTPVTKSLEKA